MFHMICYMLRKFRNALPHYGTAEERKGKLKGKARKRKRRLRLVCLGFTMLKKHPPPCPRST